MVDLQVPISALEIDGNWNRIFSQAVLVQLYNDK